MTKHALLLLINKEAVYYFHITHFGNVIIDEIFGTLHICNAGLVEV